MDLLFIIFKADQSDFLLAVDAGNNSLRPNNARGDMGRKSNHIVVSRNARFV